MVKLNEENNSNNNMRVKNVVVHYFKCIIFFHLLSDF